jgi:hypothetical protein
LGNRRHADPSEPNIIAITPVIYRRGVGKGELKNAKAILVCETCLTRALTGGRLNWGLNERGGWKLWAAIRQSLLNRYSGMVEGEEQ